MQLLLHCLQLILKFILARVLVFDMLAVLIYLLGQLM